MNAAQQLYITFALIMLPIGACAAIMLFKYRADFFAKLNQMPPALQACCTAIVIFPLTTTCMLIALLPFAIWGQDTSQSFITGSLITGLCVSAINAAIQYHRSARLKALEKKIQGDLESLSAKVGTLGASSEAFFKTHGNRSRNWMEDAKKATLQEVLTAQIKKMCKTDPYWEGLLRMIVDDAVKAARGTEWQAEIKAYLEELPDCPEAVKIEVVKREIQRLRLCEICAQLQVGKGIGNSV